MFYKVLGVPFIDESVDTLVDYALKHGGLIVVPSGPGLAVDLTQNADYRRALLEANFSIPDSGAMVLFWRLFKGKRIRRVSGLHFLWELFLRGRVKMPGYTYWVHPTEDQATVNKDFLRDSEFAIDEQGHYVAPMYPKQDLEDPELFASLMEHQPKVIILGLGGGVQERLGWWLREEYKKVGMECPAILCIGGAIGFITGNQVNIPPWADRLFLGWLFRCISEPRKFIPRYWSAIPLAYLIMKYGENLPPLKK